ncbi:hypothetical protein MNBD_IGNAVI01-2565 [hydrothermal vent metagenome]|uniref:MobA-like NTP transferase domain-containing protein n=1 Tax=hydrothermal vent metagenome TaxID=652676 RepID=A0A3B1C5L5_9ZZZZ
MTVSGLLIASGLSSRISGFKPLLQYEGKSFLIIIVEKLLAVLQNVVIIVGYKHNQILSELNKNFDNELKQVSDVSWTISGKIKIIYNENYKEGMFTSLQLGVKELSDSDWILYHFIDQPNLPQEFYSDILKLKTEASNWVQPMFNEVKGHPVLFGKKVSSKIIDSDRSSNLRIILNDDSIKKYYWNCSFPQILEDIDTDEDYQKLISAKL